MDKIQKFLVQLNKKEREILSGIFSDIRSLNIRGYDVKPLKSHKNLFRLRKGKIRIIFVKTDTIWVIVHIGFRKDIYKNL